jgi:hypothetical protein
MTEMAQQFELEKQRRDLEYKVWSDKLDAEVDEAKMTTSAAVDIRKLQVQTLEDIAETGS